MIHLTDKEVYTDDATKVVHRKGTEIYAARATRLQGDTIDDFEEVDAAAVQNASMAAVSESERKRRISAKVHERYSLDDEVALIRQKDDSDDKRAEYEEYCTFAEMCKREVDAEIAAEYPSQSD